MRSYLKAQHVGKIERLVRAKKIETNQIRFNRIIECSMGLIMRRILFPFQIAMFNSIGYLVSVGLPIFIDPLIKHHFLYGPRSYEHSNAILLLSIILFFFTLLLTYLDIQVRIKSFFNFMGFVCGSWLLLPYFKPEYPHPCVLLIPIAFSLITSTSIFIHYHEINFKILELSKNAQAKIEKIKLEYETWFRFFLAILAGYVAVSVAFFTGVKNISALITPDAGEQFIIQAVFVICGSINAFVFLSCVCIEFLRKINFIKDKLNEI